MTVGFDLEDHMQKPHALQRLVEAVRGLHGHLAADALDFPQLGGALLRCALRQLPGEIGITVRVAFHRVDHNQYGAIEEAALHALKVGQIQGIQRFLGASAHVLQALSEHGIIVHGQMGVAGGDVALVADDAQIVNLPGLLRIGGVGLVLKRAALPVRIDVPQHLLVFLRNGEAFAGALVEIVQLANHPVHGILRKDGRGAVFTGLIAHDERLRLDVNAHVFQNFPEHVGALEHDLIHFMLPVGVGGQNGALCAHSGLDVQKRAAESLYSLGGCSEVFHDFSSFNQSCASRPCRSMICWYCFKSSVCSCA